MGIPRALLVLCIATAFLSLGPRGSLGRRHLHKRQQSHGRRGNGGHRLQSPVDSPADPPAAGTSTTATPSNSTSDSCAFDVRSFGAVGDGVTDDTEAFRSAWRAACSVESATLLVPSDGVFMITSTIFSGPCQPGLVFQLIRFFMSCNLTVRDLRIENSPQFHIKFDACEDVHIEGLIGSLGMHNSEACVSNVSVKNAVIRNSDNGVRIKTWQGGMGSVSDISFDTVYMENVRNCIIIDQYYCSNKGYCQNQSSAVYVSGVTYDNIKGTYDVRSPPMHFACSDTLPCTNITMSEVELLPHEGELVDDPFCWNAYGVMRTVTIPPIPCLQDGQPESLQEIPNLGC
ncbi:hypothetical protein BHE74_00026503 [Ensete ventricosum]|nr:hypothetical protein BHE74_00026503 [Ensete ventricosum]